VEQGENNSRCWSPDGTYLLYQHRALTFTRNVYSETVAFGPREVHRIDASTMQSTSLAANVQFDYHLECNWRGDWVGVRQMPFSPQTCPVWGICGAACLYGREEGCPEGNRLALNMRTGALRSWGDAALPPLPPTPTPWPTPAPTPIPWPNLRAPVYTDPAGRYGLYVGLEGRSLWCMQPGQPPVEWVEGGEVFFYVP